MKKIQIDPAKYKKLLKLAQAGKSKDMIGTVLGSLDPKVTEAYLAHLKATDPDAAPEGWLVEEGDDDDEDLFGDGDDDEPEVEVPPAVKKQNRAAAKKEYVEPVEPVEPVETKEPEPAASVTLPTGTVYPELFRFRTAEGETVDLECMSKSPKFGFLLRFPVPKDLRTVNVKGREFEVDLLALQRDPAGTTEGVPNQKLITLIELDM